MNWLAVVCRGQIPLAALFSVLSAAFASVASAASFVWDSSPLDWHGRRHCRGAMGGLDFSAASPVLPVPCGWPVFASFWHVVLLLNPFKALLATPVLGIVGGVGAYTSAGTFGAVELGQAGRLTMMVSVGLLWAAAFPLLVHLAKRLNP